MVKALNEQFRITGSDASGCIESRARSWDMEEKIVGAVIDEESTTYMARCSLMIRRIAD